MGSSAFTVGASSNLPDVQTLEQAIGLNTAQRKEFLGQLSQMLIDAASGRMQTAGQGSVFATSFGKVCKAVDRSRGERRQKRKLLPVSDPQLAALQKRSKNKRKQASQKRKVQEMIVSKRGALGTTRVKKPRTLV